MARPKNKSDPVSFEITVPSQTHAYLVELATVGALGWTENGIASQLVIDAVEDLIRDDRARKQSARPVKT